VHSVSVHNRTYSFSGVGLNVLNDLPTTSLVQLVPGMPLTLERVAAVLACTFERMWNDFVAARGSFEPFIELYLERWLHSCVVVVTLLLAGH
jgi:biotin--protein ligase